MKKRQYICTILLISYNHEKYIKKTIESIIEQSTHYSFKIHVFDDFSSDSTPQIILDFAKRYPNIIFPYLAKYNQGYPDSFWKAYLSVDTKYFIVLEGGDYWCNKNKLELQINALEMHSDCSFCGHDTYLVCLDEKGKEYPEWSHCCTQNFLKRKNIFSYKDFHYVYNDGYIPCVSARLIRTESLELQKIVYTNSVLFYFTQFYYLLLKGNYYYYDFPMSVYQEISSRICPGKAHFDFLNVFIQAAVDLNKQTNNIIADKIYADCMSQIDFRLKVHKNNFIRYSLEHVNMNGKSTTKYRSELFVKNNIILMEDTLPNDKYYYLCTGGLGLIMLICSCKTLIEKKLGGIIHLLICIEHEFILKMYSINDYTVVDINGVDLDALNDRSPVPAPGKIYIAYPFVHRELQNFCLPVLQHYSTVRYGEWVADFLGLDRMGIIKGPNKYPKMTYELREKINRISRLEKLVLFLPEAYTIEHIAVKAWEEKVEELKNEGLTIISCVNDIKNVVKGTKYLNVTAEEIVSVGMSCHSIYSLRNGICDLLHERGSSLYVFYPSHADHFIYSVNCLFNRKDINEEIVLKYQSTNKLSHTVKPLLFGKIRMPNYLYRFFLHYKKIFIDLKLIKILKKMVVLK
jgi:glycosyltransferase involved in cell wall biosynthesis